MALSELQLGLIALGGAALVGVVGYNKWQESRARRKADAALGHAEGDALIEEPAPVRKPPARVEPRLEPVMEAAAEMPDTIVPAQALEPREADGAFEGGVPPADAQIELPITVVLSEPMIAGQFWLAQQDAMNGVAAGLRWLGQEAEGGRWIAVGPHAAQPVRELCLAVQLADRRGPLREAALDAVLAGLQQLADKTMAVVDYPARAEVLARAGALDEFCAGVDVQIGVNVISRSQAFAGSKLRGLAEAAGMVLEDDGLFHARNDAGATLFTLGNLETALFNADTLRNLFSHGVTLTLDVPRVPAGGQAFDAMIETAQRLASALGGEVVDDNRAPLGAQSLGGIRSRIVEFQGVMSARGIPAGSAAALQLFS